MRELNGLRKQRGFLGIGALWDAIAGAGLADAGTAAVGDTLATDAAATAGGAVAGDAAAGAAVDAGAGAIAGAGMDAAATGAVDAGAAAGAGAATDAGLGSLTASGVVPAAEAFGAGGGSLATDAALSAGAAGAGDALATGADLASGAGALASGTDLLSPMSIPTGAGLDTAATGFGTSAGVPEGAASASFDTPSAWDTVSNAAQDALKGKTAKDALGALTKYGPLALQGMNLVGQRGMAQKYAQQIRGIGGTQNAVAQQMISDAQAGKINASDQAAITQWQQQATAQAKNYFAKAGLSDSSMAQQAINDINTQAATMYETARQNLLQTGMSQLNITDKYQQAAVQAEMGADQVTSQQFGNFLNTYGQWMRQLPTVTGAAGSGTPAPAAPAQGQ